MAAPSGFDLSGIKKVELSDDGGSTWTDYGKVKVDSEHAPESQSVDASDGRTLYAGDDDVLTLQFFDQSNYASLRGYEKDDSQTLQVRLTAMDGTTEVLSDDNATALEYTVQSVTKPKQFSTPGRNHVEAVLQVFYV